jgi:hypothetical protein
VRVDPRRGRGLIKEENRPILKGRAEGYTPMREGREAEVKENAEGLS